MSEANPYESPRPANDTALGDRAKPPSWAWKWASSAGMIALLLSQNSWLSIFAFGAFGWTSSIAWPRLTIRALQSVPILSALLLGGLLITGVFSDDAEFRYVHRSAGHALTILTWVAVPTGIGALLQSKFRRYPLWAMLQSSLLFLNLVIVLECSFTGYMGPAANPDIGEETHNRFVMLHQCVLPALLVVLVLPWFFLHRERRVGE